MKAKLIAVSLVLAARAFATNVDLGPNGTYFNKVYDFDGLTGTVMNGQSITLDFNFNTSVHLFSGTNSGFLISLGFQTNGTNNTGFAIGTGYILDNAGSQMCGMRPLGSARSDDGAFWVGLFPLFADETGLLATDIARPLDFYGVRFQVTLPDDDLTITAGGLSFFTPDFTYLGNRAQPFRVGPHVPDTGATYLLLATSLVLLLVGQNKKGKNEAWLWNWIK